jgi:hypothetical protein
LIKKKATEEKHDGNQLSAALDMIMRRLDDVEAQVKESMKKHNEGDGASKVAAEAAYNTPRDRLSEYSVIPTSAIEPFALAKTCGSVLDRDVLDGEVSLCTILTDEMKRLLRGKGGKLLGYAAEQAKEEAQKTKESLGDEARLGEGM